MFTYIVTCVEFDVNCNSEKYERKHILLITYVLCASYMYMYFNILIEIKIWYQFLHLWTGDNSQKFPNPTFCMVKDSFPFICESKIPNRDRIPFAWKFAIYNAYKIPATFKRYYIIAILVENTQYNSIDQPIQRRELWEVWKCIFKLVCWKMLCNKFSMQQHERQKAFNS